MHDNQIILNKNWQTHYTIILGPSASVYYTFKQNYVILSITFLRVIIS